VTESLRSVSRSSAAAFVLILLLAAVLRVYLGTTAPYIHDEENNAIPLARTISFVPGALNLPLRGENHGALPAYVVKFSSAIFGPSPLGFRALHILLGLGTILIVFRLALDWYGPVAATWAAALLAFNEYYLPISSRVTAQVPFLFLVATALFAFSRFIRFERSRHLYGAAAATGLAFYCKEHAVLLLPVFLLALLHPALRPWLRRPHPYLAAAMFALFIVPDLYWNITTPETTVVRYGDQEALQAGYANHLRRIGGLGVSPYPLMFYARRAVMPLYESATGRALVDETPEYPSINPLLGALLLGSVLWTLLRSRHDPATMFLVLTFGFIFALFTLIERGNPPGRLDPVSWIWVEATMFPAVVLTGARLADAARRTRLILWSIAAGALAYGVVQILAM
jgi:4-amino-4-deoxy-L-arabinose transferase-like glycosyltransferase